MCIFVGNRCPRGTYSIYGLGCIGTVENTATDGWFGTSAYGQCRAGHSYTINVLTYKFSKDPAEWKMLTSLLTALEIKRDVLMDEGLILGILLIFLESGQKNAR